MGGYGIHQLSLIYNYALRGEQNGGDVINI
jgi:hypothetical protein